MCVCVCVWRGGGGERERERMKIWLILRNWLTRLWRLGKSKIWWGRLAGWRIRELQLEPKGSVLAGFLFLQRRSAFLPLSPSDDWRRSTHIMGGNPFYSKSTDLNINLIKRKHLHRNIQSNVWSNIWAPWLGQVDIKLTITLVNFNNGSIFKIQFTE